MRRRIICTTILIAMCSWASTNAAQAEGLFRRVPNAGEWCRYNLVMLTQIEESEAGIPEQTGRLVVRALDVVEHAGEPHQWIEIGMEIDLPSEVVVPDGAESMEVAVLKILVRRDQLDADGDPLAHIARAWSKGPVGEPELVDLDKVDTADPAPLLLRMTMCEPLSETKSVAGVKSVQVEEKEIECKEGVTGILEPIGAPEGLQLSGEMSYWTAESVGFGVAAAEYLFDVRAPDEANSLPEIQLAVQLDFDESGTGAESKLPEQE